MKNESHVGFCVYEFGNDPSVVTNLISFTPTKSWLAGDPIFNHPTATWRNAKWELGSPLPLESDIEDHIEALLSVLEENVEGVSKAIEYFSAEIRCAIYYHENGCNQGFNLSESVIMRIAKLGLSIDFDLYFLGNEGRVSEDSEI